MKNNLLEIHRGKLKILDDLLLPTCPIHLDELSRERKTLASVSVKDSVIKNRIMNIDDTISAFRASYDKYLTYIYSTHNVIERYCEFDASSHIKEISINEFIKSDTRGIVSKRQILDEYFMLTENLVSDTMSNVDNALITCDECHAEMTLSNNRNMYVCLFCGKVMNSYSDACLSNMSETYTRSSVYNRKNHLKEWLNQLQAKENADVPLMVIDTVMVEIKNMNIMDDLSKLNVDIIRKILKKKRLSKYYENCHQIMYCISGIRPKTMPLHVEKKILSYFKQIEEPFSRLKKNGRKNILRYSYIIFKLCELLEVDDFLPHHFTHLKSRSKLIEQDAVWKLICEDLKWQFIASV
jgi:hypothetical protein